jgi:hypothetical protein
MQNYQMKHFTLVLLSFLAITGPVIASPQSMEQHAVISQWAPYMVQNTKTPNSGVAAGGCRIGASTTLGKQNEFYRCLDVRRKIVLAVSAKCTAKQNELLESQLNRISLNRSLSLCLALTPDGSIADVFVSKSSGSSKIDSKAVSLIKNAGPFIQSIANNNHRYLVHFPSLKVEPSQ